MIAANKVSEIERALVYEFRQQGADIDESCGNIRAKLYDPAKVWADPDRAVICLDLSKMARNIERSLS